MEIKSETYVVLWSPRQKLFHIENFKQMIEANMRIFERDSGGDYILMSLNETRKDADEVVSKLKKIRDEREV